MFKFRNTANNRFQQKDKLFYTSAVSGGQGITSEDILGTKRIP